MNERLVEDYLWGCEVSNLIDVSDTIWSNFWIFLTCSCRFLHPKSLFHLASSDLINFSNSRLKAENSEMFIMNTRTTFSYINSEQFLKQNTIVFQALKMIMYLALTALTILTKLRRSMKVWMKPRTMMMMKKMMTMSVITNHNLEESWAGTVIQNLK